MNITPELVQRIRRAMKEYDSAKDMDTRIAAGHRLDASVDGLTDKQIPQLLKMLSK